MAGPRKNTFRLPRGLIPAAALLLLAAIPAYPFFQAGVPRTNDLFPHLYRTFALDQMIRLGYLWPRWSAHLVHGFGYPVFNFFPSLAHWGIEIWHLAGLSLAGAYRVAVYAHFAIAALASCGLGRALTRSAAGGWALAAVYTLSPYLLYDAIVRGSPPESQALALLPLLLLGLWRLWEGDAGSVAGQQPDRRGGKKRSKAAPGRSGGWFPSRRVRLWFGVTAVTYAGMILSHHPVTLQVSLMAGGWLLLRLGERLWDRRRSNGGRPVWHAVRPAVLPVLALLLGGLLSAFFSLPALLEIDATRAELSISQGYTYQANFLSLADLFRWPLLPADPARLNPPLVRPLPLLALAWAVVFLPLRWSRLDRARRRTAVQFTLLLLLAVWLVTPASAPVWETLPLLHFTLYPWRLLGWASLCTAVLAALTFAPDGGAEHPAGRLLLHPAALLLLTAVVVIEAVPWLFPPLEPVPETIDLPALSRSEIPPFLVGTTTLGEFLPAAARQLPDSTDLRSELAADPNADRLLLPEGAVVVRQSRDPLDARYLVTADRSGTLIYRQFDFPGWRVEIDGRPVRIQPGHPDGLITAPLPSGSHELRITFGSTPIRITGNLIAAAALLLLGWIMRPLLIERGTRNGQLDPPLAGGRLLLAALTGVAVFAFFALVDTPLRRPTLLPDGVRGLPAIEPIDFAGEIRLLTYEQSAEAIGADEPVTLTTYWRPLRGIGIDYAFGVQVVDDRGVTWHRSVTRPADWRFIAGEEVWPLDRYRLEPFAIDLLDGTPPGDYRFLVGLVRRDTGQTAAAHEIGHLRVVAPARGERPLEDGMVAVGASGGGLTLLGARQDRREARPGDPMRLATLWRLDDPAAVTSTVDLQLVGPNGQTALAESRPIVDDTAAVGWQAGDRLRRELLLRLPAALESGTYRWQAVWAGHPVDLGEVAVKAPERSLTSPEVAFLVEEPLGDVAALLGATLLACGSDGGEAAAPPCGVRLVWRAEGETVVSYRVFVHLLDASGQIAVQADGEPAGWSRPTTGWLPPEIIVDDHPLTPAAALPAGPYTLIAGLYDPASGRRLLTPTGEDHIPITTLTLPP